MCVGATLCSISVADVLYTLGFEHVPANHVRSYDMWAGHWATHSMGATFLLDLGNRIATAPTAPAPIAMLRGVRAGMFEAN